MELELTWVKIVMLLAFVAVGLVYTSLSFTGSFVLEQGSVSPGFAKCLASKAVVYGHRQSAETSAQLRPFGQSAKDLDYIDCSPVSQAYGDCLNNGITTYPTWVVSGERHEGQQSLERLAELTGCRLQG